MKKTFKVFIFLSLVSLFADIVYEGGRPILGPYAYILGASAIFASLASFGELISYIARFFSGLISTKIRSSKIYWFLIILGYALNLAIPFLAFTKNWFLAIILIFIERIGKGLRAPVRDVILAEVSEKFGKGKAFGLHETLDQIGAIIGPLIVSISLFFTNSYSIAFFILIIPAIFSIFFVLNAYFLYPEIKSIRKEYKKIKSNVFWVYSLLIFFTALGFIPWINFSYILKSENFADYFVSLLYFFAMLADCLIAFPVGYLYDKIGPKTLILMPIFSSLIVPLLLTKNYILLIISSIFWGFVMSIFETNTRAIIADIMKREERALGYGIFGLLFGISWSISSIIFGYLYENFKYGILFFPIFFESIAFILLILFLKKVE